MANPVEKRPMCQSTAGLALAADALVLDVYKRQILGEARHQLFTHFIRRVFGNVLAVRRAQGDVMHVQRRHRLELLGKIRTDLVLSLIHI